MKTSGLCALFLMGCATARPAANMTLADGGFGYHDHPKPPPPPPPASFVWPTRLAGVEWKHETIPFPLDFAPELPYRGTEELRFAPGFFDPEAPGYWSYAFVWFVEGDGPRFERATVEANLTAYFVGLTKAVAKEKLEPDVSRIETHLTANVEPGLVGTVRTVDAFRTGNEVTLNVRTATGACGSRRFLLVRASPRPATDAIWTRLNELAASFQCK